MDDILVKSWALRDHITDLRKIFNILHKYRMKLNLTKCTFGVTSEKFLDFIVSCKGIKINPKKNQDCVGNYPSRSVKDVKCLIGKVAALNLCL